MIKRINSARVSLTQRRLLAGHLTIPSVLITPRTFSLVCFYRVGNRKLIYIANIGLICRYTHYLRREDEQLAKNVWDLVQQNNDPTNAPYHFTVRCSPGGAECPAGRYVLTSLSLFSHSNRHNTIIHHNIITPPSNSLFHRPLSPHYQPSTYQFFSSLLPCSFFSH